MRVINNPTIKFDDDTEVKMLLKDGENVIEIEQGNDIVWIPIKEAKEFCAALDAFVKEVV
ncbi:MAG: hypothetical protein CL535_16550 [Ahrensia sp.]|nr:hypothetical protein [Ahrensia sp.]MBV48184.1 hypothetical protein [Roseobacter sp.]MBV48285.1 hypothetical protein [Roseobacter sp.]|tara:strand:- start:150009 stop:150188 length:180 start_codon:yes stop_codon:yes gene_type:complete